MIERAVINVGGPPGAGKTTLIESLLRSYDGLVLVASRFSFLASARFLHHWNMQERAGLRQTLQRLVGLDEHVALNIGDRFVIQPQFESGHSYGDRISAMQYLRFSLTADQQEAVRVGDEPVAIVIDHPHTTPAHTGGADENPPG